MWTPSRRMLLRRHQRWDVPRSLEAGCMEIRSSMSQTSTQSARAPAATRPLDLVAWRPELERQVLASRDVLDMLIFRPAQMYGRSSSAWTPLFGPLAQAIGEGKSPIQAPMPSNSQSPVCHVDDVAEAISAVVRGVSLYSMALCCTLSPTWFRASRTSETLLKVLARLCSRTEARAAVR